MSREGIYFETDLYPTSDATAGGGSGSTLFQLEFGQCGDKNFVRGFDRTLAEIGRIWSRMKPFNTLSPNSLDYLGLSLDGLQLSGSQIKTIILRARMGCDSTSSAIGQK